ncbi:MAG: protein of unknown function transrane [Acidobacteriales bacterium]|nr:protein of unknown function transrane [Terriglobales bacterium]
MSSIDTAKAGKISRSDIAALVGAVVLLLAFLGTRPEQADSPMAMGTAIAFAIAAWGLGGVNLPGAAAGAVVAFIFYGVGDWRLFLVLLVVFAVTYLATKIGSLKTKRPFTGGRSASQVMANLFVPTALLLLQAKAIPPSAAFIAAFAALAELTADTVSSEVGEALGRPTYLVTTFRHAAPGTNGGISFWGTIFGICAAIAVAATVFAVAPLLTGLWICVLAGTVGMFSDSLLGATLENRGYLNNDAVNLISTAIAAGFAVLLYNTAAQL